MSQKIAPSEYADLMSRFPEFELSYEIISHKKVAPEYDICLAIPYGKKAFLWMTFYQDRDVCFLLELGRDKKIAHIQIISHCDIPVKLAYGTILYGTIFEDPRGESVPYFVIEDFIYSCGISLVKLPFCEKLGFLEEFFVKFCGEDSMQFIDQNAFRIVLPMMFSSSDDAEPVLSYPIHHFQYRSLTQIVPHINVPPTKMAEMRTVVLPSISTTEPKAGIQPQQQQPKYDFSKPQYRETTCFEVRADPQNDIYHLYAYGGSQGPAYYGLAYIPSYRTSVFMNGIFRKIKENENLDAIEESDDEEDFEDMCEDKYVDLDKRVIMECTFHPKFRRWVPIRVVKGRKIAHISTLVATRGSDGGKNRGNIYNNEKFNQKYKGEKKSSCKN